jgi:hypothetical protein
LAFLCSRLSRQFCSDFARATLLIGGIMYGSAWILAEYLIARSSPTPARPVFNLPGFHTATRIFPLDFNVRTNAAFQMIRLANVLPPDEVIREIDRALEHDPYAYDLKYDRKLLVESMKHAVANGSGLREKAQ